MSSYRDDPLGEPIFFTPPRGPDRRMPLFKGGGASGQVYYENQDKLLGTQADIATNMYNQYAANGAPLLEGLADEAKAGVDAEKYAGIASADVQSANANSQDTMVRNAQRMGVNAGSGNFAQAMADNQFGASALAAGAQNKARRDADNMDWARRSDVSSLYSGMPGQATASLSNAAQGYGNMGSGNDRVSMANAQGYGAAGATLGKALFAKDGGQIKVKRGAQALAAGGMPQMPDWRQRPSTIQQGQESNPMASIVTGAAPSVAAALAKPYLSQALAPVKEGIGNALSTISAPIKEAIGEKVLENTAPQAAEQMSGQAITDSVAKQAVEDGMSQMASDSAMGSMGTTVGTDVAGTAATDTAASAVADTAATAAAEAAATEAAAATAAAATETAVGTVAAANAWNPVGWALGAATLLGASQMFADGGDVRRKDMTVGGDVKGPGTATSDDVPAWLSDGEYVVNAESVKMVGKHNLDKLNNIGLQRRSSRVSAQKMASGGMPITPDAFSSAIFGQDTPDMKYDPIVVGLSNLFASGGEVKRCGAKMASGGMLGVALGAGVDQWNKMEDQDLRKNADSRQADMLKLQQIADGRQAEQHGYQMRSLKLNEDEQNKARGFLADTAKGVQAIRNGDMTPFAGQQEKYNGNAPGLDNGYTVKSETGADGAQVLKHLDPKGAVVDTIPLNQQTAEQLYLKSREREFAFMSPGLYEASIKAGQAAQEKALDRKTQSDWHAGNNAATLEAAKIHAKASADAAGRAAAIQRNYTLQDRAAADRAGQEYIDSTTNQKDYMGGMSVANALGEEGVDAAAIYKAEADKAAQRAGRAKLAAMTLGVDLAGQKSTQTDPAEVKVMKHLMATGVAKDDNDAWDKVSRAKESPGKERLATAIALTKEGIPVEEAFKKADALLKHGNEPTATTTTFADLNAANAAAAKGAIKPGTKVMIGGRSATWQ